MEKLFLVESNPMKKIVLYNRKYDIGSTQVFFLQTLTSLC